ncbi:MAG: chromosomal replication initiator protein DnaA [Kiritimatiellae bacterium]|nr:chromosomal replication initiator protein DnaA [Kiritimatiellia bacterium]
MNDSKIDTSSRDLWEKAKSFYLMTLHSIEEKSQAERYFGMITSVANEEGKFVIFTHNEFAADLIRKEYANKIKGSFLLAGASSELEIEVRYDPASKPALVVPTFRPTSQINQQQQMPVSSFVSTLPLKEEFTFSEFVSGPSNSFAIAAAKAVVANPGKTGYNPLFIHGGTGLGKTHLMQAIGNELKQRNQSLAICYITAEEYLNEYINHMKMDKVHKFREKYRSVDVLLIDDVQFFKVGGGIQEEFFNTFNALKDKRKQIVMTSDVPPKDLVAIESRLISRFEGGMLQEIESPNIETRLAIISKKAESLSVKIPNIVLNFIAENIKSHVRAMEGALATVEVFVSANPNMMIDKNILMKILDDFIQKESSLKKLTIEEIQQTCAKRFGTTMADILSHERTQTLVTPRQLAMYISRKYTSKGLQEIAKAFDKKHATIISGVKTIQQRLSNEPSLKTDLEEILSTLGYKLSDSME